jgi:HAD superfamily hydrolase (TIGR01484 family)
MAAYSKELIIFDLDGTLTPSKSPMDKEMADLLIKLLERKKVAVISGGGLPQFQIQFLHAFPTAAENFTNLILMPTSGARLYVWKGSWVEQYAEHLTPAEKERIMTTLNAALPAAGYVMPQKIYGQLIEDRGSQITFSALGQTAPLELKKAWDPTREKLQKIKDAVKARLPEFEVSVGGSTSVDITRRGINKSFAIRKLEEHLKMPLDHMLFVGDAIFPGGNDYPAKATGIDCIAVKGPEETKEIVRSWVA